MKKIKDNSGSITLFVLLSILFFTIVLVGLYIHSSNKIQKQQREIKKVQSSYNTEDVNELYEKAYNEFANEEV